MFNEKYSKILKISIFCWATEIRTQTEGFKDLRAQPLHYSPIYINDMAK